MRTCKDWLGLPRNYNGDGTYPCTASSQILRSVIEKEMRRASERDALNAKRDLMSTNLKDMFSVGELSYITYSRLDALLEQEYTRALDRITKHEEKNRKGATK